jgi:hypothetical protein
VHLVGFTVGTFSMLERNIKIGKSIIFPGYVGLFHSISGVECMNRNMGKYLQMRMLNANDRYHADNGCSKCNTNKSFSNANFIRMKSH